MWLGSTAWDGYPDGMPEALKAATTEEEYRGAVGGLAESREDFTTPEMGWPWPWPTSHLTDYSYAFDDGRVWASSYGSAWWPATEPKPEDATSDSASTDNPDGVGKYATFPIRGGRPAGMTWGPRSGVIVIGAKGPE